MIEKLEVADKMELQEGDHPLQISHQQLGTLLVLEPREVSVNTIEHLPKLVKGHCLGCHPPSAIPLIRERGRTAQLGHIHCRQSAKVGQEILGEGEPKVAVFDHVDWQIAQRDVAKTDCR